MTLQERYEAMKEEDEVLQRCPYCHQLGSKNDMDRHHPRGRHGENLLKYFYAHRLCHGAIHDNPKEATERGLLKDNR